MDPASRRRRRDSIASVTVGGLRLLQPRAPPPEEVLNPEDGAVHVDVRAHVMSLHGIDIKEQEFTCKLWLQARGAPAHPCWN